MPVSVVHSIVGDISHLFKRKAMVEAVAESLGEICREWWSRTLPKHFETGAAQRYQYAPRSRGYMIKKARMKGHQQPLVWSGNLRRAVLAFVEIKVMATGKNPRAKAIFNTPSSRGGFKYADARRRGPNSKNIPLELTRLSTEELSRIREEIRQRVVEKLNNNPNARFRRGRRRLNAAATAVPAT